MMVTGVWGKKIGMTQVFDADRAIPVTVIDIDHWIVTNIRKKGRDGHDAVQVGADIVGDITVGKPADFYTVLQPGNIVDVVGVTKGCGFAGVVKRHGFAGPPGSHGSTMGRRPGSIGFMRSQGRVIKGKRLPGHMGVQKRVARGLNVVRVEPEKRIILVKGSVPGKAGTLLFVRKA